MTSRILVTGGCGFIGSWTVRELAAAGYEVCVFDNLSSGRKERIEDIPNIEFFEGDIRDPDLLKTAMRGADKVVHLAAQVSVVASVDDPVHSLKQNIEGFVQVLEAVRVNRVRKFVYASSAAVYGAVGCSRISEDVAAKPISPYGLEKYVNEQYASLYRNLCDVDSIGLRYFNVYGPGQDPSSEYAGVISKFVDIALGSGVATINGDGLQTRDFVYVKDVAKVNRVAIESSWRGVCNVATGASINLLSLLDEIGGLLATKVQRIHGSPKAGDIRNSEADISLLQSQLNCRPSTEITEGLAGLISFHGA